MPPTTKFTKRQKKGIAFRERKQRKSRDEALDIPGDLEDVADVPGLEDQVILVATQSQQGRQVCEETLLGRGNTTEGEEAESQGVVGKKKRKKTGEETERIHQSDKPKKRRKGSDGCPVDAMEESVEDHGAAGETGKECEKAKQRFILFLGNLKYTTTSEAIQALFSICVPPPIVRLLTPKPSTKSITKAVTKSKGCAFLEFKHRGALQQGLKLHHSELDGRRINVELTAGGGGKGSDRLKKLKERNKELEGQRRKRRNHNADTQTGGIQRSTLGEEQIDVLERTWIAGDAEGNVTRRGGQKGSKKRRSGVKGFGSGVNAIPVG